MFFFETRVGMDEVEEGIRRVKTGDVRLRELLGAGMYSKGSKV